MDLLVNIDVDDLAKGVQFYTQALGLKPGRTLADGMVELTGASSRLYLLENKAGTAVSPESTQTRNYQRHWTPVHFDVAVENINAAVEQARSAGAKLEYEVQKHPYGHLAMMSDPFGHGFCLIEFSGRGYDEILIKNTG